MWQEEINKAIAVLREGGTLLCPTDTIWGISADATNEDAVAKVFEVKERPANKSMIVLVSSKAMLEKFVASIPPKALEILDQATRPTSIIYPQAKNLAANVSAANGSIGVRIVQDEFCMQLLEQFGKPIISTSANISSAPSPSTFSEIAEIIKSRVDYCIQHSEKEKESGQASSIYIIEEEGVRQIR